MEYLCALLYCGHVNVLISNLNGCIEMRSHAIYIEITTMTI